MAQAGDEDAMTAQQFERDFEEMMQGIPDLQAALATYQEARQRITDRRRARGFWPSKSRGKVMQGKDFQSGAPYVWSQRWAERGEGGTLIEDLPNPL